VPKIDGTIKYEDKPFTGMLIINDLSGNLSQLPVKDGKPDKDLVLQSNYYTLQFVSSNSSSVSSYPQFKMRVPEGETVQFDKLEIEQLV
jgi:hypothetical protein